MNSQKMVAIASFTQTSIGPHSRSTRSAAASTADSSATSVGSTIASPPACSISRFAASRPSIPRATRATRQPFSPKRRAVARPTPADAPVMTTVFLTHCTKQVTRLNDA